MGRQTGQQHERGSKENERTKLYRKQEEERKWKKDRKEGTKG